MSDVLWTGIRFLPLSEGGQSVPLRGDLDDPGVGDVCAPGGSMPLLLAGGDCKGTGVTVELQVAGECEVRGVWEAGASDPVSVVGDSGQVILPVNGLFDQGVGIRDLEIDWQMKSGHEWKSLGTTSHRTYLTLGRPQEPWDPLSADAEDTNRVWTELLEFACLWAIGASDVDEASHLITEQLFSCGLFAYHTTNGASFYTTASDFFECEEFLERLKGGEGYGGLLNCTDCATIVSTLANALGARLQQVQLMYMFKVNEILAIGTDAWQTPFKGGFSYHEIAWNGELGGGGEIFDACLSLDRETGMPPSRMVFDEASVSENLRYRNRLTVPGPDGFDICEPEPRSLQIRKLD